MTHDRFISTLIFLAVIIFISYSLIVYRYGSTSSCSKDITIIEGKMLWQKHNCTACHQLYGLGGYIGPDLTHIASAKGKGAPYIQAILTHGMNKMPDFKLSDKEILAVTNYLLYVDSSGRNISN